MRIKIATKSKAYPGNDDSGNISISEVRTPNDTIYHFLGAYFAITPTPALSYTMTEFKTGHGIFDIDGNLEGQPMRLLEYIALNFYISHIKLEDKFPGCNHKQSIAKLIAKNKSLIEKHNQGLENPFEYPLNDINRFLLPEEKRTQPTNQIITIGKTATMRVWLGRQCEIVEVMTKLNEEVS